MGKYNDIWARVNAYDESEKKRKSAGREERRKRFEEEKDEGAFAQIEDCGLSDETTEGEETIPLWVTTDYKIIKNYPEIKRINHFNSTPVGYQYQISFTIFVDGNLTTFKSHEIANKLEKEIDKLYEECGGKLTAQAQELLKVEG